MQRRRNQQGPGPRFQDLQHDRGTNLHVKRACCSPRLSLDHKSRCSPAKNAKHSERVARICGAATMPSDAASADENAQRTSSSSSSPADLEVFLWTEQEEKSCRVSDGDSSPCRPPFSPPNQPQSKTDSHWWFSFFLFLFFSLSSSSSS